MHCHAMRCSMTHPGACPMLLHRPHCSTPFIALSSALLHAIQRLTPLIASYHMVPHTTQGVMSQAASCLMLLPTPHGSMSHAISCEMPPYESVASLVHLSSGTRVLGVTRTPFPLLFICCVTLASYLGASGFSTCHLCRGECAN